MSPCLWLPRILHGSSAPQNCPHSSSPGSPGPNLPPLPFQMNSVAGVLSPLSVALQGQSLLKPGAKGSKAPGEMKAAVPMLPQTGMLALDAPSHPHLHCHCFLYCHSASALSLEFCPQRSGPLPHLRTPHTARRWVSGSRGTGENLLWLLVVILTSPRSVTQGGLGRHDKIESTEFKSCPFCFPSCDQGAGCLPVQTPSFLVYKTELRNLA